MGRTLCYLGLVILAGATWFLVGEEAGWVGADLADHWFLPLAKTGVACFVVGLVLGIIQPLVKMASRGRCARCGAPTERNQTYCHDHLQETVLEARDEMHRSRAMRRNPGR